ncbi:MAG: hypothetical protein KDD22_04130, partial [Bdellovibrionales bacterium]|nr:hypothetical protein [Bdellovibrionales bacterium]
MKALMNFLSQFLLIVALITPLSSFGQSEGIDTNANWKACYNSFHDANYICIDKCSRSLFSVGWHGGCMADKEIEPQVESLRTRLSTAENQTANSVAEAEAELNGGSSKPMVETCSKLKNASSNSNSLYNEKAKLCLAARQVCKDHCRLPVSAEKEEEQGDYYNNCATGELAAAQNAILGVSIDSGRAAALGRICENQILNSSSGFGGTAFKKPS